MKNKIPKIHKNTLTFKIYSFQDFLFQQVQEQNILYLLYKLYI